MVDLTGKKDAITIKKRYQEQLDENFGRIMKQIHLLHEMNHKLKWPMSQIEKLQRDMAADEQERADLYSSLQNLLLKETTFEKDMWDKTLKGQKVKSITVKQKFHDTDIDEVKYNAMQEYLKQYPQYVSKSSFSKILDKISEIEKGIKDTKKDMHKEYTDAKREIAYFPSNIMNARNKIATYKKILAEGEEKLKKMRYNKSLLYKLASESTKLAVTLDTLKHINIINEKEEIINNLEGEVKKAEVELNNLKI